MEANIVKVFLESFFEIFKASLNECKLENKRIHGSIRWRDDNQTQDFLWVVELEESELKILKLLCEYLIKSNLIYGDRIIISESELQNRLIEIGWDYFYAKKNIDILLSVEIRMIDDGEETDSFFIHF
jgi:hypothetical protein